MRKEKHAPGLRQRNAGNGDERCWLRSAAGTLTAIAAVVGYQAAAQGARGWREVGEE